MGSLGSTDSGGSGGAVPSLLDQYDRWEVSITSLSSQSWVFNWKSPSLCQAAAHWQSGSCVCLSPLVVHHRERQRQGARNSNCFVFFSVTKKKNLQKQLKEETLYLGSWLKKGYKPSQYGRHGSRSGGAQVVTLHSQSGGRE